MNKNVLKYGGIIAVVAGSVMLYFAGSTQDYIVGVVGAVFSVISIIGLVLLAKKA